MLHADVALQQRKEHRWRDIQGQGTDHGAADDAADHRDEGQQRQGDQQGEHPRHHQQFDGIEPQGADGIDFFIGFHRADLCGKGAGSASGHENGGQQHGELPQEGKRYRSTVNTVAPKSASTVAPRNATTAPTGKVSSATIGAASRPVCSMCATTGVTRQR